MGFDIRVRGLDELRRKLEKMPEDIKRETERMLREAANRIVFAAQMRCPDAVLREKITSQVTRSDGSITVTISAPPEARRHLLEAYEENKNAIPSQVADAIRRAIRH